MLSVDYTEAIVEVLDILDHSDNSVCEKIPKKLIEFWERNKSDTYKPNLDHTKALDEMELKEKTRAILAMIYLNYLCDDKEKEEIQAVLNENENKYQEELREKYNVNDIFKNKIKHEELINSNLPVEIKKDNFFKKLIKCIKKFFNK